jgi:Flp pilus assembly protein TadD
MNQHRIRVFHRRGLLTPLALALGGLVLLTGCADPPHVAHFKRAHKHFKAQNYSAAESEYREAIRLKPDYAEAYCYLGAALGKKGEIDEAVKVLREAIRLKPGYTKALENLAVLLDGQGRKKEAREYWEEAAKSEKRQEVAEWIKKRLAEPD